MIYSKYIIIINICVSKSGFKQNPVMQITQYIPQVYQANSQQNTFFMRNTLLSGKSQAWKKIEAKENIQIISGS